MFESVAKDIDNPGQEDSAGWLDEKQEELSQFVESSKETFGHWYDRYFGEDMHVPWRLMAFSVFCIWLVLLMVLTIPFKRHRGE